MLDAPNRDISRAESHLAFAWPIVAALRRFPARSLEERERFLEPSSEWLCGCETSRAAIRSPRRSTVSTIR